MTSALVCTLAVLLDTWLGEPRRAHPLSGFYRWVGMVERHVRAYGGHWWSGPAIWLAAVGPFAFAALGLALFANLALLVGVLLLYLALGATGITEQAMTVADAVDRGDHPRAVEAARWMIGDEPEEGALLAQSVRGVLGHGATAVFGPLFWYLLAGPAGVVVYRLSVGAKSATESRYRFIDGTTALLDWLPARLGAVTYALVGDAAGAWRNWKRSRRQPLVSAGSGAIGTPLGKTTAGLAPTTRDLRRAVQLLQHALWFWLVSIVAGDLILF